MSDLRAIPGLSGFFVDAEANLFALKRGTLVRLRCGLGQHGYRIFYARRKQMAVSRAVCAAFHGPAPTTAHQAAHLDGNTLNNVPANLAWKTPAGNAADRLVHGTQPMGVTHWAARLSEADVLSIRARVRAGERRDNLAREHGVHVQHVHKIVRGDRWKHLPGPPRKRTHRSLPGCAARLA